MSEAVRRRFTRLANADSADAGYDPGFASVPNLVVIDGGKGQLSAALGALDGLDLPRVAAIGLAKRIEEVYIPGRSEPILLPPDSPALLLLRRIRDEAHRFALKHHRRRRAKASGTDSLFDRLPGVGPARKQALLQHFGSPAGVLNATADELAAVPGLPRKTAREIHAFLNKTGGAAAT
jgi:excinuclease ABC subunit C